MRIAIPLAPSNKQFFINKAYIEYLQGAGFEPFVVSPLDNIALAAETCDGLLLPGGIDIDPTFYGDDNTASYGVRPDQDDFDRKIYASFFMLGKPIFGICRGFQVIMREFLHKAPKARKWIEYRQNIHNHGLADSLSVGRDIPTHSVQINWELYGKGDKKGKIFVNSMHHQCVVIDEANKPKKKTNVKVLAVTKTGLSSIYTGKAAALKPLWILEGFELTGYESKIAAVQWHPEELKDYALLQTFFGTNAEDAADTSTVEDSDESEGRVELPSSKEKAASGEA